MLSRRSPIGSRRLSLQNLAYRGQAVQNRFLEIPPADSCAEDEAKDRPELVTGHQEVRDEQSARDAGDEDRQRLQRIDIALLLARIDRAAGQGLRAGLNLAG